MNDQEDRTIALAEAAREMETRMGEVLRELTIVELGILRGRFLDEPKALEAIDRVIAEKRAQTCACGFRVGERVTMRSAIEGLGEIVGTVTEWKDGCGHIVLWDDLPTATGLPNPNVRRVTSR